MFDDMYLHMREINSKYVKNKGIDPNNGMPLQSYHEVSSHYWNQIYCASKSKKNQYASDQKSKRFLDLANLDEEFYF